MRPPGPIRIGDLASRTDPAIRVAASPAAARRGRGRGRGGVGGGPSLVALQAVLDASADLIRRLRLVTAGGQVRGELSPGRLGILRDLERRGPQTVPQLARARSVSRQHVQVLVNPLAEEGFVEFMENPVHRRSRLVRLAAKGKEFLEAGNQREAKMFADLVIDVGDEDMRSTAKVLRAVREALGTRESRTLGAESP